MTSVASSGTPPPPMTGFEHLQGEFLNDDESWAFISQQGTSNPSSVGFFPSPDGGSLRSFGIVGRLGQASSTSAPSQSGQSSQVQPSPPAPSPLFLDQDHQHFSLPAFVDQASFGAGVDPSAFVDQVAFSNHVVSPFSATSAPSDIEVNPFAVPAGPADGSLFEGRLFRTGEFGLDDHDIQDFTPYLSAFSSIAPQPVPRSLDSPLCLDPTPRPLDIPAALQHHANVPPWNPTGLKQDDNGGIFVFEEFVPQPTPVTPSSSSSAQSASPHSASVASPVSPHIKQEQPRQPSNGIAIGGSQQKQTGADAIRKVKNARIEKKRASPSDSVGSLGSVSSGGSSSSGGGGSNSKFVIMTPTTISAQAGKPNLFECFDAMRMTQRGRKGPLANETKENALQVRRVGACFCCHARKVKCDAARPCKNCTKLTTQVPQIVCWQFQDFLPFLFPSMLHEHLGKEHVAKFLRECVTEWLVDGVERPCLAELSSGPRLRTVLRIQAKAFTARVPDVLQHWRQDQKSNGQVALTHGVSAAIGIEIENNAQREELRRLAREYIANIVREPYFADEMTAWMMRGDNRVVPREALRLVQRYALQSQNDMVKKALNIYTTNYVNTRHLTFTPRSLADLMQQRLVSREHDSQTPRLLARQFKAILDEINMREVQLIFEAFSKNLKPKMRREWAPCMAAFLVLAMFMEEIEIAADFFATSQNQINHSNNKLFAYNRRDVVALNKELENMPFKQFAYQFHQVYQTHPTDASAKSFNPLLDDSLLSEAELGDPAAVELVRGLRPLLSYPELPNMTMEPILGSLESHPHPRDVSEDYNGRLVARFLLSFTSLSYLLNPS